jgi:hypothetical protein
MQFVRATVLYAGKRKDVYICVYRSRPYCHIMVICTAFYYPIKMAVSYSPYMNARFLINCILWNSTFITTELNSNVLCIIFVHERYVLCKNMIQHTRWTCTVINYNIVILLVIIDILMFNTFYMNSGWIYPYTDVRR